MRRNLSEPELLLASRALLNRELPAATERWGSGEAEGGCGVIGIAASEAIAGRHLLQALSQMRNRGNNKGGGIAAVGLAPEQFGVAPSVLESDYLLAIAYLDPAARGEVEKERIHSLFHVDHQMEVATVDDFHSVPGIEIRPPDVVLYFVRPREERVAEFQRERGLAGIAQAKVEDELVYQNSYRLNLSFYAEGRNRAFVLSHARNLLVLKMVGYGDDVIRYYRLEDLKAHVWIGHHRYPTKGRVWHPGGAHPFIGMHEALVHNGDFANYASITEYLAQRQLFPLFMTDTEVSALVFDLHHRIYGYPLEYVIESIAPTTERDFILLPEPKRRVYEYLQQTHIHGSPDGPWFFLIAESSPPYGDGGRAFRLIGITDTSMLRPQVFALQQGEVSIGFAASEKQAIDAALESLASEDERVWPRADLYWNARGGSHTDGGAFLFSVTANGVGQKLTCTDKFGQVIASRDAGIPLSSQSRGEERAQEGERRERSEIPPFDNVAASLAVWSADSARDFLRHAEESGRAPERFWPTVKLLTDLHDRRYATGRIRRSSWVAQVQKGLHRLLDSAETIGVEDARIVRCGGQPVKSTEGTTTILLDARGYGQEGRGSAALEIVRLIREGFRRIIIYHARGHRFLGSGLGAESDGVAIDVYGSAGDYLGSGIDGAEITVHNSAQDQLSQIAKRGKLVVHGDVGQTFMYGAKGSRAFILGNAAGRPLINAVGRPRVVINGTCLDYLAESFMAGDPLNDGGFVILNAIASDVRGRWTDLDDPYPGGNLFSLASGGAIYIRDPRGLVGEDQLNGGAIVDLADADWAVMEPFLSENERLFGIPLSRLLEVDGKPKRPRDVYRKVVPSTAHALQAEEAWVRGTSNNNRKKR